MSSEICLSGELEADERVLVGTEADESPTSWSNMLYRQASVLKRQASLSERKIEEAGEPVGEENLKR